MYLCGPKAGTGVCGPAEDTCLQLPLVLKHCEERASSCQFELASSIRVAIPTAGTSCPVYATRNTQSMYTQFYAALSPHLHFVNMVNKLRPGRSWTSGGLCPKRTVNSESGCGLGFGLDAQSGVQERG